MRWHHGHSMAAGIVFGIVISTHAVLLIILGGVLFFLFSKFGALYRAIMWRLNRRWAIRP